MDRYRLEYEMKKKGVSTEQLCEAIGMSRSAFYRKTHSKSEFTLSEINAIIDFLGLESPIDIFFTEKVS